MKKLCTLIALLFCIVVVNSLKGQTVMGGEILYRFANADSFDIILKLYRDCNGIPVNGTIVRVESACKVQNVTVPLVSKKDITGIPQGCGVQSRCTGTFSYGIEECTYIARARLGGDTCCNYKLSWTGCCWSGAISTGGGNTGQFIQTTLNKCLAPTNTSPEFVESPTILLTVGRDLYLNHRAADNVDNDLVTHSLTKAMTDASSFVTYSGQWSYTKPFTFFGFPNSGPKPSGFNLDSASGGLYFRPTKVGEMSVYAIKISEWRTINGQKTLISEITRPIMGIVVNAGSNRQPMFGSVVLQGNPAAVNTTTNEISICNNTNTYCVDVEIDDGDSNDSGYYRLTHNLTNITTSNVGTATDPIIRICYTPTTSELSSAEPLTVFMEISDSACPLPAKAARLFTFLPLSELPDSFSISKSLSCRELTLQGVNNSASGNVDYNWEILAPNAQPYTIKGASVIKVLDSGWHKINLTVSGADYCNIRNYKDSIFVSPARYLGISAGPDISQCFNASGTVNTSLVNGTPPFTFLWDDNSGNANRSFTASLGKNTYWVNVTDGNNCVSSDTVVVNYYNPTVSLTGDTVQCIGKKVTLTATFANVVNPSYGWAGFSINTAIINPTLANNTTKFDFTLIDSVGCTVNKSHTVKAYNPQITFTHTPTVCVGDSMRLSLSVSGGLAPYATTWSPQGKSGTNVTLPPATASGTVNYAATSTDAFGCIVTKQGTIVVNPLPVLALTPPGPVCETHGAVVLTSFVTPTGGNWSGPGVQTNSFITNITGPGTFPLTYSYTHPTTGCSNTKSTSITVQSQPLALFTSDSISAPVSHTFLFSDNTINTTGKRTWNFGDPASGNNNTDTAQNTSHVFTDSGIYVVRLITNGGACPDDTATKIITVYKSSGPDAVYETTGKIYKIYPNPADDVLYVEGDGIKSAKLYDMLGRELEISNALLNNTTLQVNTSAIAPGLYTLQVFTENNAFYNYKVKINR